MILEPRPPFPIQLRDQVEFELYEVTDVPTRWLIRRLVANAYAHGFADGDLYRNIIEGNDRAAAQRDDEEDEP